MFKFENVVHIFYDLMISGVSLWEIGSMSPNFLFCKRSFERIPRNQDGFKFFFAENCKFLGHPLTGVAEECFHQGLAFVR